MASRRQLRRRYRIESDSTLVPSRSTYAVPRRWIVSVSPPCTISVSDVYCVTRYPLSFLRESITASEAGKLRLGPVGRPSFRAVAVSSARPCTVSAAGRAVLGGGGPQRGCGRGLAPSGPPTAEQQRPP